MTQIKHSLEFDDKIPTVKEVNDSCDKLLTFMNGSTIELPSKDNGKEKYKGHDNRFCCSKMGL